MLFKKKQKDLKTLVKEGNLVSLKSMVDNDDVPLKNDASTGMTLLHLAVKYDKLNLIEFLLTSNKIDINAQDSSGTTPLLMAFRDKRFEAAKLLMDANARLDISTAAGQTTLTYVVRYGLLNCLIPDQVMRTFRLRLLEMSIDRTPQSVVLVLYRSVSLETALTLKSSEFMIQALRSRTSISFSESRTLILEAMYSTYLDNLRVLLCFGPDRAERRGIFRRELCRIIEGSYPNLELAFMVIKRLVEWDLPGQNMIGCFKKIFVKGEVKAVRMLMESGIVEYAKRRLDVDLTAHLFANKNYKVVQILHDRDFDVNARGDYGLTALHFAVRARSRKNVQFLLDRGADANVKDNLGTTPLFDADTIDLFMPMVMGGADVQVLDNRGFAAFECDFALSIKQQSVLGHLAVIEAQGTTISEEIWDRIQAKEDFKKRFEKYRSYIDRMMNYVICDRVTMFIVLTENPKGIERYMRNKRKRCKKLIAEEFRFRMELGMNNVYYSRRLEENLKLVLDMSKLKNRAADIVARTIGLFEADHLIVDKIVDFLTYEDLRVMLK